MLRELILKAWREVYGYGTDDEMTIKREKDRGGRKGRKGEEDRTNARSSIN